MDQPEKQNDKLETTTVNNKKVIQPINPEQVRAFVKEKADPNIPQVKATQPTNATTENPKPLNLPEPQTLDEEWKPSGTLASRIPALRNYGIVLVVVSLVIMYLSRIIWKFSNQSSARALAFVIYTVLGAMLVSGVIILLSKSKVFVLLCLNIIIGLSVLVGLLSLLTINIIGIMFTVLVIGSVVNIRRYVKQAA